MNQINLNGTEVKVEEINGKTIVSIQTADADVHINEQCIWSKYDKPEYMDVPVVLRDFIRGRNDFLKTEEKQVVADLWEKGSTVCSTLYIPKNKREKIVARLDLITSLDDLEHDYLRNRTDIDEDTANRLSEEFKTLFKNIEKTVNEAGYQLSFSHASGIDYYGWWDVSFNLEEWNEEQFLSIWNSFIAFDKRLSEVSKKYPM